jgi:hypothetical protein
MSSATRRDPAQDALEGETGSAEAVMGGAQTAGRQEAALPLPGWLTKMYFLFPIILYIPDAIFNYYVYSDGVTTSGHDPFVQAFWSAVWGFVAIGVVGMAYLLSVLAPWHWSQGHYFQAFFCAIGVIVATLITTWNSLAFRSTDFASFKTDQWVYMLFPQLQTMHAANFSVTMVLVSVAPPFWGLFWAIVQPIEKNRSLRHMQESHAERLLRLQQEAEVKRLKAETNATVREAQLRGMAQTAAAAREQAVGFINKGKGATDPALPAAAPKPLTIAAPVEKIVESAPEAPFAPAHEPTPLFTPSRGRDLTGGRRPSEGREMYNHAAPAAGPHAAPDVDVASAIAQPALLGDVTRGPQGDVDDSWHARPRPMVGAGIAAFFPDDNDVTGTTGPRPAVRRASDVSPLLVEMNTPPAVKQVRMVIEDLRAKGITRPSRGEVITAVMDQHSVDEELARKMVLTYKAAQKSARG